MKENQAINDELIKISLQNSARYGIDASFVPESVLDIAEVENKKNSCSKILFLLESLSDMFQQGKMLPYDLVVTEPQGCVLHIEKADTNHVPPWLVPGLVLSEASIGTNAFALAINLQKPVKINGGDHYLKILKEYISYAGPVTSRGHTIAIIGFFAKNSHYNELQVKLMDSIISTILSMVEKMLEARKSINELLITQNFLQVMQQYNDGVIAVDNDFRIIQANKGASEILGVPTDDLINSGLNKFSFIPPDTNPALLPEIPLRSTYTSGKINASLTPIVNQNSRKIGWIVSFSPPKIVMPSSQSVKAKSFSRLIGQNKEFTRLIKLADMVAKTSSNILITGESGTGKELFARAIYEASSFHNGPFVAINTSAIPKELIESELFGYVGGAFTGALKEGLEGKFVQANGGVLFLDEIGDMPVELQPKVLRALEERKITPIGGRKEISINVKVISASNRNIEKMVSEGKFRADLFYRLNVIQLQIMPLRDRKDDITLLADYFLKHFCCSFNKKIPGFSSETLRLLNLYDWPGNIRELGNAIEMAVNLCDGTIITVEHLPPKIACQRQSDMIYADNISNYGPHQREIIRVLNLHGGNIKKAARELGIGRTTLYRRIEKYNLSDLLKSSRNVAGRDNNA